MNQLRPRVIQVIESAVVRGNGTEEYPFKEVVMYHTLGGKFLAEYDPTTQQNDGGR